MSTAVEGIARLLAEAGVGDFATDRVLNAGQVPITVASWPSTDGPAVVVSTYAGGPEPDTRNGWQYPRLQVKVRHDDPLSALALESACFAALQFVAGTAVGPRTLPGGTWFLQDCYALQSEAQPLGLDDNGRSEFVRNYQLTCWPS